MWLIILISLSLMAVESMNVTEVLQQYILFCGHDYICDKSIFDNVYQTTTTYQGVNLCPQCSCDENCLSQGTCCLDKYLQFPTFSCYDSVMLDATKYNSSVFYPMILDCSAKTKKRDTDQCMTTRTISEKFNLPPVTDPKTNFTFKNKHCAKCHGVNEYIEWELSISCYLFSDFNFFSSYDEVIEHGMNRSCIMKHIPPENVYIQNCSLGNNIKYETCNLTKAWRDFDSNLVKMCESPYRLNYHIFKNIFCYMCNPVIRHSNDIVNYCNYTGVWEPRDNTLERACLMNGQSKRMLPYKNVFCFLCNRNNTKSQLLQDVHSGILHIENTNALNIYQFEILSFQTAFYDTVLKWTLSYYDRPNMTANFTNLLLKAYSLDNTMKGLCNTSLLPNNIYSIINSTVDVCSCEPSLLFVGYVPCLDVQLTYPLGYIRNVIYRGKWKTPEEAYLVTNGCWKDKRGIFQDRCNGYASDTFSFLPVYDNKTKILYKNLDCFICNSGLKGAQDLLRKQSDLSVPFFIKIICNDMMYIDYYRMLTFYDIIKSSKTNNCRISLRKNEDVKGHPVIENVNWLIQKCNITGQWKSYDRNVEYACENLYTFNVYSDFRSGKEFKNIFCAMCNFPNDDDAIIDTCNDTSAYFNDLRKDGCKLFPSSYKYLPYKNIFCYKCNKRYRPLDTDVTIPHEIAQCKLEPTDCFCSGPECVLPIDIPGAKFRNLFTVDDNEGGYTKDTGLKCNGDQIFDNIKNVCRNITCYKGKYLLKNICRPLFINTKNLRYKFKTVIKLKVMDSIGLGSALNLTIQRVSDWWIRILRTRLNLSVDIKVLSIDISSNVECKTRLVNGNMMAVDMLIDFIIASIVNRRNIENGLLHLRNNHDVFTISLNDSVEYYNINISTYMKTPTTNQSNCRILYHIDDSNEELLYEATPVSEQMICRYVEFSVEEYRHNNLTHQITFPDYNLILAPSNYQLENSVVRVCVEILKPHLDETPFQKSTLEMVIDVLNIVCTCISLLCLLLTFLTYCVLRPLQTLPGKNNMCLIFSLFVAQFCLQFGTIWRANVIICKCLSIVLHLCWLSTFAWMNICSFHMYKVFSGIMISDESSDRTRFYKYFSYSFGIPFLLVVTNIGVGLAGTGDIGYGGNVCFISNSISKIILFICPVALICLINIGLFSYTAYKIHNRPDVRSTRDSRLDFLIYVKMFALTGITWIGQIVDALLPLSVLTVIVTILSGLQGLFIFLSYVCNKRILAMYSTKLKTKETKMTNSTFASSVRSTRDVQLSELSSVTN